VTEALADALGRVRSDLLDDSALVRAVASGRRRSETPPWRRVELRWVDLKAGRHLQITRYDATQAHTANHAGGPDAEAAVDALLAEPFGNWTVETTTHHVSLRVTKKGDAAVHSKQVDSAAATAPVRSHDRAKERLLPADDPLFAALGLADGQGRIKPSRMAKYRQVEDFLRILDATVSDAIATGRLRRPTAEAPLHVIDLGCGNGYLTFAAERFLSGRRGLPVRLTGVDVKAQSAAHNTEVAEELGIAADFVVGTIADADLGPDARPDVVLALHACDTATDEALARAVEWQAPVVLAAPCCHHDIASQLRQGEPPAPYAVMVRDGILRERFADTLTDGLRALLMRGQGYRVEVMEFVDSQHTPRNTLLRAVRTARKGTETPAVEEYDALVTAWGLRPRLGDLLEQRAR
jgi:SAM-dependent methyltransferase